MMSDSLFVKILVVGDSGVGKTSILNQYCYSKFDTAVNPTVGCDFCLKVLTNFQGKSLRLQLWDIAGQDRFTAVSKLYVKGALGCIIVADITNPDSLTGALRWKEVIEENADHVDGKMIPMVILQNKYDLLENQGRKLDFQTEEYIKEFANKHDFKAGYQVSAKSNMNLDNSIECLVKNILKMNIFEARKDNFAKNDNKSVLKLTQTQVNQNKDNNNCGC